MKIAGNCAVISFSDQAFFYSHLQALTEQRLVEPRG
jgi:hypothetical protein